MKMNTDPQFPDQRVSEKKNGVVTKRWVWAGGNQPAEERDAAGNVTRRFYPQGEQAGAVKYFYTKDHLGSIREVLGANGTMLSSSRYDAWGVRTTQGAQGAQGAQDAASFGFTGHLEHEELGLVFTLYRAYDPVTGRWLSRDPIGESGGINLYGYVSNNPINYVDPDGRNPLLVTGGAGALIGGIYGGVTGGLTGGFNGALSGALGGAATGGLIGLGVNPIVAGAAGGALSSLANQALNGEDPRCPSSLAKTAVGTITGGIGGGVGARLPSGLASEIFTGAGVGASATAGETVVNAVDQLGNSVNQMNQQRQQQIDQIFDQN